MSLFDSSDYEPPDPKEYSGGGKAPPPPPPVAIGGSDHQGPNPERTIREAFLRFHHENPHVYDELLKLSQRAYARGVTKIGIGMLFEVLRWGHLMRTQGDDFKLNNNYRSYYVRMIVMKNPRLDGFFELRRLHGRGLSEDDVWNG